MIQKKAVRSILNENVLIKNDLKMVKMKDGCSFQWSHSMWPLFCFTDIFWLCLSIEWLVAVYAVFWVK